MATGKLIRLLAQRRYSIWRPTAASCVDPGSILGSETHSKISYFPLESQCSYGHFHLHPPANGVTSLFRRYLATSSRSTADQNAESASKDEVGNSLAIENRASKGVKKAADIEPDLNARVYRQNLSAKEIKEADEIGYSIIGLAKTGEFPKKPKVPVFAVVQVGAHQFKVCSGDRIVVEKLKYADVNQKILLNKVLMMGTKSQTIIGRPMLPDAAVCALVEEQGLGATVIIFKKKRRKNYRRTNFHRQELTTLRIMDISGLDKSLVEAIYAD